MEDAMSDNIEFPDATVPPLTQEELAVLREHDNAAAKRNGTRPAVLRINQVETFNLTGLPLAGIGMRSIEWLEKPLWQTSAFQLLAGAKGSGKGTYLAGLAARRSNAGDSVLFVSTEDSAAIDLKPRLVAAAASIDRCHVVKEHVRLPADVDALRRLAIEIGNVGLLVIDPVANHIGDRNSNSDAEVRDAIAPLNRLADELHCLVVGVRHPGKDRSRGAVASILGSTAWVDTPRAVVMIATDDEDGDVRVIQVVAGNRARNGTAQAFRIDAVDVESLAEPITLAVALGDTSKDVEDLIDNRRRETSKSDQARELILETLDGVASIESDELDAKIARETGLTARTARDVRMKLGREGLVRSVPDKDDTGTVVKWHVQRTNATYDSGRPATKPNPESSPTHHAYDSGLFKPNPQSPESPQSYVREPYDSGFTTLGTADDDIPF
jgi:hypothetical protein